MTYPTHVLAGLIIGKMTGDYPTAIAGSLSMDLDHLFSYYKHGILFKPRKFLKAITDEKDPWGDQRGILHNILVWIAGSLALMLINFDFGLVFSLAWFLHLVFDALDSADYYPFYPSKKFIIKGFVKYYSKQEIILDIFLLMIFLLL